MVLATCHKRAPKVRLYIDKPLETWSSTLKNEEDLPENWLKEPKVLVGIELMRSPPPSQPADRPGRNRTGGRRREGRGCGSTQFKSNAGSSLSYKRAIDGVQITIVSSVLLFIPTNRVSFLNQANSYHLPSIDREPTTAAHESCDIRTWCMPTGHTTASDSYRRATPGQTTFPITTPVHGNAKARGR
ncbi:hypothetical protein B0H11DRAFT_2366404 [Mycena galericulata]|nr:hypothetical protein B0H11DRAFT_2366404 [Mycena galericulata]